MMQPAKLAVRASVGWSVVDVETAAHKAAAEIVEHLQPFAQSVIDDHRAAGDLLVLASTSPLAFTRPLAEALGFDGVIGTDWGRTDDEHRATPANSTARSCGARPRRKRSRSGPAARRPTLGQHRVQRQLLRRAAARPRRQRRSPSTPTPACRRWRRSKGWPVRHLDKTQRRDQGRRPRDPGVGSADHAPRGDRSVRRHRFQFDDKIPADGPAIIVFNHRSYFDPTVMGLLLARAGRNVRGLGKKEVFDVPHHRPAPRRARWRPGRARHPVPTNRSKRQHVRSGAAKS